jgi:enoyl-[acyl-carrier protein] reductase I
MSTAKAALDCDTKYLAFEAGRRHRVRVNTLSAGPYASRAASVTGAIGEIVDYYEANQPSPERRIEPSDIGPTAAFLCSPLAASITGTTVYVDNGFHSMGKGLGPTDESWALGNI